MANVNLGAIYQELLPGLKGVEAKYPQIEKQWPEVFPKVDSKLAFERFSEVAMLSMAREKTEGAATFQDTGAGDRYIYQIVNKSYGLEFSATREAIDDNQYKTEFPLQSLDLREAFIRAEETDAAAVFNTGNVYNTDIIGDGQPLFSTSHPIDGSTYGNRPTVDADLNETALEMAQTQIRGLVDVRGNRMRARASKLVIPKNLEWQAHRLLRSDLRTGTGDNDVNATKQIGYIAEAPVIMDYLVTPQYWFLTTTLNDRYGLVYLDRVPFETDMKVDFTTKTLQVNGYQRRAFGYRNWRGVWGTFPTT